MFPPPKWTHAMGKNSRRRRRPQLPPSASNTHPSPSRQLPRSPQSERISFDEGFQQLLSDYRPHPAARELYKAWLDGDCAIWCDGTLLEPHLFQLSLSVDVWTDDDGCERLKLWAATDMVGNGDHQACVGGYERARAMEADQSARKWQVSAAGITALLKESNTELIAEKITAAIAELPAPKDGIDVEAVKQLIDEKFAAAAKTSPQQRRKPGTKKHGAFPSSGTLGELCEAEMGYMPDPSAINKLLRDLAD